MPPSHHCLYLTLPFIIFCLGWLRLSIAIPVTAHHPLGFLATLKQIPNLPIPNSLISNPLFTYYFSLVFGSSSQVLADMPSKTGTITGATLFCMISSLTTGLSFIHPPKRTHHNAGLLCGLLAARRVGWKTLRLASCEFCPLPVDMAWRFPRYSSILV